MERNQTISRQFSFFFAASFLFVCVCVRYGSIFVLFMERTNFWVEKCIHNFISSQMLVRYKYSIGEKNKENLKYSNHFISFLSIEFDNHFFFCGWYLSWAEEFPKFDKSEKDKPHQIIIIFSPRPKIDYIFNVHMNASRKDCLFVSFMVLMPSFLFHISFMKRFHCDALL